MNDRSSHKGHDGPPPASQPVESRSKPRVFVLVLVLVLVAVATFGVAALLVDIYGRKQEARTPFVRVAQVDEVTTDPEPWGENWPVHYELYKKTAEQADYYGGSSAMPASKLEEQPWLKRLYSGYAFSIDYREARGHAYMLSDQLETKRITERSQPGACLHCHSSVVPTYRRVGLEAMGEDADAEALAAGFQWPAVMRGFEEMSGMSYPDAYAELEDTPDGTGSPEPHPVSCVDCHDPETMKSRVTRPGFVRGIAALAASDAPVPHLPSIEEWREGDRAEPYDPNVHATRQEMRSYVCAQCHVEYYCGPKETLFFPWSEGLRVEDIQAAYEEHTFPDGEPFSDWKHGETGARVFKAQHPEFELWSQGIHARSGVSCTDCHMPYEREGAMKISSHWVRSPLENVNASCQTCHNVDDEELVARVEGIQERHEALLERAGEAMTQMLDAIRDAKATGASEAQLQPIYELQKASMWRLDFISSENSSGFHASQEAARVLAESIDLSRQAQVQALDLRAPRAPASEEVAAPVEGVTPTEESPVR